MEIEIYEELQNVRLGVSIKNIMGSYLSGGAFELNRHLNQRILARGKYCVEWEWDCLICEEIFCIDVAILKNYSIGGEKLTHIHDAYLFKVIKIENPKLIQSHIPMIKGYKFHAIH
jgi:hypothetical protein